jgi:hypothetical protein
MGRLAELPTEILQRITSLLSFHDKASYLKVHKQSQHHFYPSYHEQQTPFRV